MILIKLIFIFFLILYIIVFSRIIIGWFKLKNNSVSDCYQELSVIIAFRNEYNNLKQLIESLIRVDYPNDLVEFIFVNDHSDDRSCEVIDEYLKYDKRIKLIHLDNNEFGKKSAIEKGIKFSSFDNIVFTDADCVVPSGWLRNINLSFSDNKNKFILGPVIYKRNKGLLSKLIELDFISLIITTAGGVGISTPFMCNGANYCIKKDLYFNTKNLRNDFKISSGDDIFLLHTTKKLYGNESISFMKIKESIVETNPPINIIELINQRLRWINKSSSYNDLFSILLGVIIFVVNSGLIFFLINIEDSHLSFLYLSSKLLIDLTIAFIGILFFNRKYLIKYIPLLYLIYPIYIYSLIVLNLFIKVNWKERTLNSSIK